MKNLIYQPVTIIYDNGKDYAQHKKISKVLKAECYFAIQYHSWERGLNDHTNSLTRQYLPKETMFIALRNRSIKIIEELLNH